MDKNKKNANTEAQRSSQKHEESEAVRINEFEEKYKRALADYQNLEKRTAGEKIQWIKIANKNLVLKLLPVLDTLMLACQNIKDKGLDIAISQFIDVLEQEGVHRIETAGKMFDPKTMEAVETVEGKEGIVIEEMRPGYMFDDIVIRAAMVKVGKEKPMSS